MKIKAGIIGAAGYTGGETIRLLLNHPFAEIVFAQSNSSKGQPVASVHKDLFGETDLVFSDAQEDADVLFLCAGHGEARKFMSERHLPETVKIIDLSQDFRLKETNAINDRTFVYGLPEMNKSAIMEANSIANPGCFATAIQLALLPLAKAGMLCETYVTGITGSTGAGQGLSSTSHFSWRSNNIQAYKSMAHQHIFEINESLSELSGKKSIINFVPWRGDFTRGIYVSCMMNCSLDFDEAFQWYRSFYAEAAFTHVSETMIDLKQVVNTNKCLIHLEKQGDKLVVHAAIDNLLKGAAGQAVQNMNLMFGLPEHAGLKLKANSF